jgi:hypothetical protein
MSKWVNGDKQSSGLRSIIGYLLIYRRRNTRCRFQPVPHQPDCPATSRHYGASAPGQNRNAADYACLEGQRLTRTFAWVPEGRGNTGGKRFQYENRMGPARQAVPVAAIRWLEPCVKSLRIETGCHLGIGTP